MRTTPSHRFAHAGPGTLSRQIMRSAFLWSLFLVLLPGGFAVAGEWRVLPTGLQMQKNVRSGVFTVINEGAEPANFQITAREWGQDATGKEVYGPTREIVYFPKIVTIAPGAQQVIRVGYQGPVPQREKTFRLFVREIPGAASRRDPAVRMKVAVATQFAMPIFVKPQREQVSGSIGGLSHAGGELKITVRNTGNTHFRIDSLTARGAGREGGEVFSRETKGWYVVQNAQAVYGIPLSQEECARTGAVEITASGDAIMLKETVKVENSLCSP